MCWTTCGLMEFLIMKVTLKNMWIIVVVYIYEKEYLIIDFEAAYYKAYNPHVCLLAKVRSGWSDFLMKIEIIIGGGVPFVRSKALCMYTYIINFF